MKTLGGNCQLSRSRSRQLARYYIVRDRGEGDGVVAVHPRGNIETQRALQLLNQGGPIELRSADLQNQTLEYAATETETPIFTWMGKVLAAPGAPDTTGLSKLP